MTTEALFVIVLSSVVAVLALTGAVLVRLSLSRTSATLRQMDVRLATTPETLVQSLTDTRERLVQTGASAERALWTLSNLDTRLDAASAQLADRRLASDTARAKLLAGRTSLTRLRETARLLMRALEMRRSLLG